MAYTRIPLECLEKINRALAAEVMCNNMATDSTGLGTNKFEPWSTVKKADGKRKGYQKLHALIDIDTRVITDYAITPANMADIKQFRIFLERMAESKNGGTMCANAAYLARDICTMIEELGYIPRIKPKSNSTAKAKGHMSWRHMMIKFQEQYDEFKKEYG